VGASTSWNPQGLSRPVMGLLYFFYFTQQLCRGTDKNLLVRITDLQIEKGAGMIESQQFRTHKHMQLHGDRRPLSIGSGVATFYGARTEYSMAAPDTNYDF